MPQLSPRHSSSRVWNRNRFRSFLAAVLGGACLASIATAHESAPDPLEPILPVADTPFLQEYRGPFISWSQPVGQARVAIAFDSKGGLWSAGPWGVERLSEGAWQQPEGPALDGPAFALATEGDTVWVGAWDGLYQIVKGELRRAGFDGEPIGVVRLSGGRFFVGGPGGLWEREGDDWKRVPGYYSRSLTDVAVADDALWIATQRGLFELRGEKSRRIFSSQEIASGATRSLAVAEDGRLWVGSSGGIDVFEQGKRVVSFTGREGLPCTDVWRLRFDSEGTLWVATARGLARHDGSGWTWRSSLRWLPSDDVHDVAFAEDGSPTVATSAGLSALKFKQMTLAQKAAHYEKLVRERHVRPPGLVERCILRVPGDLSSHTATDTDNDGLFTGLYVGAEAYRHAATGDARAAEFAREGYRAMEFLQTVTETPGFVARTVIPSDWSDMADRNRTFTPQQIAAERIANPRFKPVENRWRKSRDGKWLWKGDTSSDEITGHYFAYGLYYDLVADEEERKRVANHVRRITDYIVDGGYVLRDIDGESTLWGVWAPERLWDDPDWQPEQGSNSVEILSFLAVAHHVTGDEKYERELARLFDEKRYRELILQPKLSAPSEYTYIDDQLLALSYRGLLAYDRNPERREIYLQSLATWFDVVRKDHSPLYGFTYGSVVGGDFGAPACVEFLRDSPLDMVDWTVDNSDREDIRLVRRPVVDDWQTDRLLPPSERSLHKWDKNPYRAAGGIGGHGESSSVHWLLPYWMGRYYGIIQ